MRTRTALFIFMLISAATSALRADSDQFTVRYLSAENVYLNGGSADGLAVGDRVLLKKTSGCTTELEIVYVAEHSASCTFAIDTCGIAIGDQVYRLTPVRSDTVSTSASVEQVTPDTSVSVQIEPMQTRLKKNPPRVSGSIAVGYYYLNDHSPSNLDFQQTTGRLNLKARRLFDRELTLNLRVRGRYDQRDRAYSSQVDRAAWENRMWELSLSYDEPTSRFSGAVGRILPRRVASAGYIDGALIESRIGEKSRLGLLAGTRPQWAYDKGALSLQKGALYFTFESGELSKNYMEQTIAGIGEYHSGDVSREVVSLQGRVNHSGHWGEYHTVELDINRSWRKEKAGESFTLSSIYVSGWYRFSNAIRMTIGYDNRTNYWSYDTRSTVDSLFDDHLRQGMRSQIDLSLLKNTQASIGVGLRKRQGDGDPTVSYSFNCAKSTLWSPASRISAQYSAFNGPMEHGNNYSARLSDYLRSSLLVGIGVGGYSYKADAGLEHRSSSWYEVSGQVDLRRNWFLAFSGQIDKGDDIDGFRLQSEIGMRF